MPENWKSRLGGKLVPVNEAMKVFRSGQVVAVAPYTSTPVTLCNALKKHALAAGLKDIRIEHLASLIS